MSRERVTARIFFCVIDSNPATAQEAPVAQSDQITQDQQIIQDDDSSTGKFQTVTVSPNAASDVALQFPLSAAGKTVVVAPLDGGTLQIANSTIDQNGALQFTFSVSDQSGVYRVIVLDPNAGADSPSLIGMVQFVVPNPPE